MAETVRIEIAVEAVDNTGKAIENLVKNLQNLSNTAGSIKGSVNKASSEVSRFDRQADKTAKTLRGWMKEKWQLILEAKDKVSPLLSTMKGGLSSIAGKAWNITLKAFDFVTAPVRGILNILKNPIFQAGSILGVSIGLKDTIDTYKGFEAAMSQVQAVSGATAGELERLTQKAKDMGTTTQFTAQEAAEAFNYMAMAGWKTSDMMNGIEGILNLAAASGEDLGTTSDIVTDALTAFGLTAADAGHFSDVLAMASSNANTNVGMMGETFKYVGAMAGTLGYSIEDTALAIGLMANAGIKSSQAGTELNSIFTRLSVNTNGARDAIEALGISFFDSTGTARPFADVLSELRTATANYTDEQKTNLANTIAGQRAQAGLLAMLNATEKDYNKLAEAVSHADGASERMAETMLDNVQGSFTLLQSALDGVKISLGERLAPYLRSFADNLTSQMPAIQEGVEEFMDWFDQKVDQFKARYQEIANTKEFENADLFGKINILWDKMIAEPFQEWWNDSGKQLFANVANDIGAGIGSGIKTGILMLLGIDVSDTAEQGVSIGRSFAEGFASGFNREDVGNAVKSAIGGMFSNVGKLLPGGEAPGLDTAISGFLLYKMVAPALALGKGAVNIGKGIFGPSAGGGSSLASTFIGSASAGTGLLGLGANTAINLGAGNLAGGASLSAGALSAVGLGSIAGGAMAAGSAVSGVMDLYRSSQASDKEGQQTLLASGAMKLGGVGYGALAGAAIGSAVPVIGTAAGALIGAGLGGIAGFVAGNHHKQEYKEQQEQMKAAAEAEAAAQELIAAKAAYTGQELKDITFKSRALTEALKDTNITADQFGAIFQEAVSDKITSSFGDITLSLQEIKDLADSIVFDGMAEEAEKFQTAISISNKALAKVKDDLASLEKQNWKASLGFAFSEDELSSYQSQVDGFIKDAASYITDQHYEAFLALRLITGGEGDTTGLDAAYASLKEQIEAKSEELQAVVQAALEDGVISTEPVTLPDGTIRLSEYEEITSLQNQISEIMNKVSEAQEGAQLDTLQIKYGGSNLDAASFQQLQSELAATVESMTANYDEALEISLTNLHLQLAEGAISEEEFQTQLESLKESYQLQLSEMNLRVQGFQLDTITEAFASDLDGILPALEGTTAEKLKQVMDTALAIEPEPAQWSAEQIIQWFGLEGLDAEAQTAIGAMLQSVAETIPNAIKVQLSEQMESLDLAEASEILKTTLGMDLAKAIHTTDLSGAYTGLSTLRQLIKSQAQITMGERMSVEIPVNVTYDYEVTNPNPPTPSITKVNQQITGIGRRATGGFTNGAELSWVGEDGPEAIIPLGAKRRQRGLELYEQVGEILGVAWNADGGLYGRFPTAYDVWNQSCMPDDNLEEPVGNVLRNNTDVFPASDGAAASGRNGESTSTTDKASIIIHITANASPQISIEAGGGQSEEDIVSIFHRHSREIAEAVGGEIAGSLIQVFANMPLKG